MLSVQVSVCMNLHTQNRLGEELGHMYVQIAHLSTLLRYLCCFFFKIVDSTSVFGWNW